MHIDREWNHMLKTSIIFKIKTRLRAHLIIKKITK